MFAAATGRPEKFLALHFHDLSYNLVVDVMPHPGTDGEAVRVVRKFCERTGLIPIVLKREHPGYLFNHMFMALLGAAQTLAADDVAAIEDIDRAWMGVFGMPIGPFGLMDRVGIDTAWKIVDYWASKTRDPRALKNAAFLKSGWRGENWAENGAGFLCLPGAPFHEARLRRGSGERGGRVTMSLNALFSPVTVNGMTLLNRAVMPAMGTGYGNPDGTVSDRLVRYLARRAKGGAGLIITEVCAVAPRGKGFLREIGAWSDDFIPGLAGMAEAIHREGERSPCSCTMPAGRPLPPPPGNARGAVTHSQRHHEATLRGDEHGPDRRGRRFLRLRGPAGPKRGPGRRRDPRRPRVSADPVPVPLFQRADGPYGGSEENRMRFVLETVAAVRKAVGSTFPVLIRISADELIKGGYDLEFTKRLAPRLVAAGADAIHASVGVYSTPGNLSIASMDTEAGFNLFRARAIREMVNVPVIAVGRINDPRLADRAIAAGDADLVSFGRQHLADPDFLAKAREGRWDDIRWCVSCNQGCIERLMYEMQPVTCTFNPEAGTSANRRPRTPWGAACG